MATPRATRYRARHARPSALPRVVGVAGLATATTFSLLPAGSAGAEPASSMQEVEQRIDALEVRGASAVEDFRQAEQQLEQVERRAAAAREQMAAEQARLDQVRGEMGQVIAAAYRRGSTDRLMSLVADGDPRTFLQRAATLDRVGLSQGNALAAVQTAQHRLAAQQDAAERELAAQRIAEQELAARQAAIEQALAEQRTLLEGLQEAQRRQLEAAREAADREASALAVAAVAPSVTVTDATAAPARASRSGRPAASVAAPAATPTYAGPASGRAKVAVEEAYRRLGTPYRWGGNGPENFDCSGFTSWVWRAAGVSLPRVSRAQYAQGRKVARADVQPGDLVYFGSPIHHVGLYVGDGQMISAPHSGDSVKLQSAFRSDYVGATRP